MPDLYTEVTACRACGMTSLKTVLDLGDIAINAFPKPGEELDYAPLTLVSCPQCELLQLKHSVNRDRLYRDYYYKSGMNESMIAALKDVVDDAMGQVDLKPSDAVLDIGSNDGMLLRQYPYWLFKHGFEPSNTGYTPEGFDQGGYIWHDYFPPTRPKEFCPPQSGYKIITALAVFYDLDDPGAFLESVKDNLHPDGIFIIQMPDLYTMLHQNAIDNVCHEHVAYWPTRALYHLAQQHGLRLLKLDTNSVNGGSVRYTFVHSDRRTDAFDEVPTTFYQKDIEAFAERTDALKRKTRHLIDTLNYNGKPVWGYGASTKGNTLLSLYDLGRKDIVAIADRNPEKWGRTTVTGIPIVSEAEFREANPEYALVLPWGFLPAFKEREREWLMKGGQFIVPLPKLRFEGEDLGNCQPADLAATARSTLS